MMFVRLLPVIFSALLMAAHFSRVGMNMLALLILLLPFSLFIRKKLIQQGWQIILAGMALVWIYVTSGYIQLRMEAHTPWLRLLVIMALIILFNVFSAWWMGRKKIKDYYI